jgi:hypothetical protein
MYIFVSNLFWVLVPGATSEFPQAGKVELTTNGRIGSTRVGNVVTVKGHDVGKNVMFSRVVPRLTVRM